MAEIDQVVACDDVTCIAYEMLARELNPEVHAVNNIPLDHDTRPAVHVDAVGRHIVSVGGVALGGDVVDLILANDSVARTVDLRIRSGMLKTDDVDPNIV